MKPLSKHRSVFRRAWIRDRATGHIYSDDAMLIAVLAHVQGEDRNSKDGKIVRELLGDINLEQ
jgi:hypothetical protein